jgi:hypothetical protein
MVGPPDGRTMEEGRKKRHERWQTIEWSGEDEDDSVSTWPNHMPISTEPNSVA